MPESGSEGFDEFYRGTYARLLRYAYGLTGDAAEAQDLAHEAYARAWARWRRLSGYDDPEGWLRLVVNRLSTDRWRELRQVRNWWERTPPPPPVPPPSDDVVVLVEAMRELPENHRRALVLYYLLDQPVADIAKEIGAAPGTIKSWLSRGRAALAARLDSHHADSVIAGGHRGT
jgi:RNA polymerase sigma-70 factor (ECF subfamily)